MKAFTVHDVFKVARFTDAPCRCHRQEVLSLFNVAPPKRSVAK